MPMSPRLLRPRAAGGFDPRAISGLALWLDATVSSSITLATGVSQWSDLSGNGRHVFSPTGNNQPAYTGSINGKPALTFDGANDSLATASAVTLMDATYGMSIFAVATRSGGSTLSQDDFGSPRPWSWRTGWTPTGMVYFYGPGATTHTVPNNMGAFVGTAQQYSTGASQRYNGGAATVSATAPPAAQFSRVLVVGAIQSNTSWFSGQIGEVLIYARELPSSERVAVERYLGNKWGIAVA